MPGGEADLKSQPSSGIDDLDSAIETLFQRYDLDMSNTIHSIEELRQLSVNVVSRLDLDVSLTQLDSALERASVQMENQAFTMETYKEWVVFELCQ